MPGRGASRDRKVLAAALVGLVGAGWAATIGLVLVTVCTVVAWVTAPQATGSVTEALRVAGQVWLAAHGTSITLTQGGTLGLTPLGLTVGVCWLLWRAGRNLARYADVSPGQVVEATLSIAVPYATLAAVLATPAATGGARPEPWQALAGAFSLACLAAGAGVLHELRQRAQPLAGRPALAAQMAAAVAAAALLSGAGALLVSFMVFVHADQAGTLWRALATGLTGGLFVLLACLALLPNAVVWGVSFVLGPGFSVGAGTRVSPFGVELGSLPTFPLLAGAPAALPPAAAWLLAVPVLAGVVAGLVVERRAPSTGARAAFLSGARAGAFAGLLVMLASWLGSGPVGAGRFETVGASPLLCGLAAALEVGTAAAVVAALCAWWRLRS